MSVDVSRCQLVAVDVSGWQYMSVLIGCQYMAVDVSCVSRCQWMAVDCDLPQIELTLVTESELAVKLGRDTMSVVDRPGVAGAVIQLGICIGCNSLLADKVPPLGHPPNLHCMNFGTKYTKQ